jgi:bifunctional UDP-N-acetylglucosamine pyrophosphorylase / glucosamine-1-phosphate N-acetyltransferase
MNKVVILAGGKGKRMKSELPKALFPINNRPMIQYLIDSVLESGVDKEPIIVVSPSNREMIEEGLKDYSVKIAVQEKPLGTGHAVFSAKDLIKDEVENVMVLYSDQPFISAKSIKSLSENHKGEVSLMTVMVEDFDGWRKSFYPWGRIIRSDDKISGIIEFKDASDEIKEIKEVNPALFNFNKDWLFANIDKIKNNNKQGEYYLTDLIAMAFQQNVSIGSSIIEAKEAIGVNTPDDLKIARSLVSKI